LQALNMSQKTGILSLKLSRGSARVLLREGEIVSAKYDDQVGKNAIFELLKQKRGEFNFKPGLPPKEIDAPVMGSFMFLMMEGMRMMDENSTDPEKPDGAEEYDGDDVLLFE
jgi:CRP/FNR family transcriptional regulator, cyclic AMP receptor protein